jgi:PAS domain S-box-containing protein
MQRNLLKRAKELLASLDIIIDLQDYTVVWASPQLKRLMGYGKDKFIGKKIIDFFALTEDEKVVKALEHTKSVHGPLHVDLKCKDGNVLHIDAEYYLLEFKDGFYHVGKMLKHQKGK